MAGFIVLGLTGISYAQDGRYDRDRDKRWEDRRDNTRSVRYRVRRGGRYYNTDERGAELLRQAVHEGYRRGYEAGQADRDGRRRSSNWRRNSVYRSGNMGYDSHVDRSQYRYYFQQGFQRGYDDGYSSRNRYGSNNGILGTFLNQILNIQTY